MLNQEGRGGGSPNEGWGERFKRGAGGAQRSHPTGVVAFFDGS